MPPKGDPIPDSTPPEAPKGNFTVEVQQPELIRKIAILNAPTKTFDTVIGDVSVPDDPLFADSRFSYAHDTRIRHYISPHIDKPVYLFESTLNYSEKRKSVNDGYISSEEVRKIASELRTRGYEVGIERGIENSNAIHLEKNGNKTTMMLGYESKEAHRAYIMERIAEERRNGEVGTYTKHVLPSFEAGKEAHHGVYLVGDVNELVESPIAEVEFKQKALEHAATYKDSVDAIYAAEGLLPPSKKAIIRPPILSDDILSEISSVESESPTHITPEQIKKELPSFEEIAGQDYAVEEAKRLVLAINSPEIFERRGVKRPKGILFYGPPGTGKTLIAKAVANAASAEFIEVSSADIGTKWYGESERLMQKVFDTANQAVSQGKKVVLFFDELDSLAPNRDEAHEATRKVVATLLQNMDGMRANPNVTIIAATNRPQDIDPALKRPGRIDKLIQVGLPSIEGRKAILQVHMKKAAGNAKAPGELYASDLDFDKIGSSTDGMSGADLANLLNLTLEEKTMAELEGKEWTPITTDELLNTAKKLGKIIEEKRQLGFHLPETKKS